MIPPQGYFDPLAALRADTIVYHGTVMSVTDATHCVIDLDRSDLTIRDDNYFKNWFLYVVRDAGGAGAAPQDELAKITDYVSSTGTFTHIAFTASLAATDEVLIVHKSVAMAITAGGYTGDIEIFENFNYISDAALQAIWSEGGEAGAPTLSATAYVGATSMQVVIGAAGVGSVTRNLTPRNIKVYKNISLAARSNKVGGDTFRFIIYDSAGNWAYWTKTIAAADTWEEFETDPSSTPSATSATPPNLEDVTTIGFSNLTASSTYLFDFIVFESLVASKVGIGYDGLSDTVGETSSVRGHLLLINDNLADAGITTYPAVANIGNGVTVAAAIRAVLHSLVAGDDYDNYTNISGSANASIDAITQKFATLFAANGANTFGPTINGAARADLELAFANIALYFAAAGAAISATVNPGGSAKTNLEQILEDLGDVLAGAGITTYPAAAAPADGVSLAEALRKVYDDLVTVYSKIKGTPASGSIDNLNVNTEQDLIAEVTQTTVAEIDAFYVDYTGWLADANIAASGATLTVRVYLDDNLGTLREIGNLRDVITEGLSVGSMVKIDGLGTFERNFKVSVQSSIAPAGGVGSNLVKYHYAKYDRE